MSKDDRELIEQYARAIAEACSPDENPSLIWRAHIAEAKAAIALATRLEALQAQPVGEIPAGMASWGPEHPDYPNRPRDWDPHGRQVRRNGASALGIGATWPHASAASGRSEYDIIGYTPKPAALTAFRPVAEPSREAVGRVANYIREYEDAPSWGGPTMYPAPPSIADLRAILALIPAGDQA